VNQATKVEQGSVFRIKKNGSERMSKEKVHSMIKEKHQREFLQKWVDFNHKATQSFL